MRWPCQDVHLHLHCRESKECVKGHVYFSVFNSDESEEPDSGNFSNTRTAAQIPYYSGMSYDRDKIIKAFEQIAANNQQPAERPSVTNG